MQLLQTPLAIKQVFTGSLVSAVFWTLCFKFVSPYVPRLLLGRRAYKEYIANLKSDDNEKIPGSKARLTEQINATGFLHGAMVVPLSLLSAWLSSDDWYGKCSSLHEITGTLMLGYFIWDVFICIRFYKLSGPVFLLHAIISGLAVWLDMTFVPRRMCSFASLFHLTECSTPLLHWRWFLIQAKQTGTKRFSVINASFIGAFAGYRLFYVIVFAMIPYIQETLWPQHGEGISFRGLVISLVCLIWIVMNYYWGMSLVVTQIKNFKRKRLQKRRDLVSKHSFEMPQEVDVTRESSDTSDETADAERDAPKKEN